MSNQFSLMLSMLFLAILIVFSGELINYQKEYAIFNVDVNQIAHHTQVYGYDDYFISKINDNYDLDNVYIENLSTTNEEIYLLTCKKNYQSLTEMFSFMSNDFYIKITIYR